MSADLRTCDLATVRALVEAHHGYGSCGTSLTYAFAVYEDGRAVAVFAWQPPPPGAAKSVCPEAPSGVLSLSRMVLRESIEEESTPLVPGEGEK